LLGHLDASWQVSTSGTLEVPGRRPPASGGRPAARFPDSRRSAWRVALALALGAPARRAPPRPQAQSREPEPFALDAVA